MAAICISPMGLASSTQCLPETLHHPTHKLPMEGLLLGSQSHSVLCLGCDFASEQHPSTHTACAPCASQERLLVVGHKICPELQYFINNLGPKAASNWPCCDLRLLQEAAGSAWGKILILHWLNEICMLYPGDSLVPAPPNTRTKQRFLQLWRLMGNGR